jgi:hypothetical protein
MQKIQCCAMHGAAPHKHKITALVLVIAALPFSLLVL